MSKWKLFQQGECWTEDRWIVIERDTCRAALTARSEDEAWLAIVKEARTVLKSFSTSFFTVTRFLPAAKRNKVEAIYAAVRYPDEVVDTFALTPAERRLRLKTWRAQYERALRMGDVREMAAAKVPCFLAAFVRVVRESQIPEEHYAAFLDAMECDAFPRKFATIDELIDSYIYGSAIVVGYFLTYVYGASQPSAFPRALDAARHLGIALQLTNFVRDVAEDQKRGRQYLPVDMLREEGIETLDVTDPGQHAAVGRAVRRLAVIAHEYYQKAGKDLDAFAPDSQTAIRACIDVYGKLNERILTRSADITQRESVPMRQKFGVLPASKYWRLPLAYLGW